MFRILFVLVVLCIIGCGDNDNPVESVTEVVIPLEDISPLYSIDNSDSFTVYVNDNGEFVIILPVEDVASVVDSYLANPTGGNPLDRLPPRILSAPVSNGDIDVDYALLNKSGIHFTFSDVISGSILITDNSGRNLDWASAVGGSSAIIVPTVGSELESSSTYFIHLNVVDADSNPFYRVIWFTTKLKE